MESAAPTKFKSSVLAALDVKPEIDGLEDYNPLLSLMKRKRNPGSPDPRRSKRVAAGTRSNIPGLENDICWCSSVISFRRISSHFHIQSLECCSHRQGLQVYPGITVKNSAYITMRMRRYLVSTFLRRTNKNSKPPLCRGPASLNNLFDASRLAAFVSKAVDNVAEQITVRNAMEYLGLKT